MSATFERLMEGLEEVGRYMSGDRSGFRVTPGHAFAPRRTGDSLQFLAHVNALALGVILDYNPARLHVIRIDNWFSSRWLYFSGKALGAIGVWKDQVTVPPFVRNRVLQELIFDGQTFVEKPVSSPVHINCSSSQALNRRITDIDPEGAFLWFSGNSEGQKRGSVMVYLPTNSDDSGFYLSLSDGSPKWTCGTLRGISRNELSHLEERGNLRPVKVNA